MKTAITNITIVLAIIMLLSHPARGQNKKKALEPESKLSKKNGTMKPVIFPVVETEEPQLYFKGIKNIKFSLIKYKDSLLDILTEANFDPGKINKKIFLDKNQIKKENTHHYQWNTSAPGSLPLALSNKRKSPLNETTFDQGLFAFRIHHLELWDKGDEAATKKYVSTIASKLKVFYKKEIDFVVRGNSKTFLVWVFNSKTRKGIQGAGVVLVRKTGETTASKKNEIGRTNRDGVCYGNLQAKSGDMIVVNDPQTRQKAFYKIREDDDSHFHANPEEKEEFRAEVFADREHYQPGSTMHIGGVVKRVRKGRIKNPRIPGVTFVIENPSDIEVKRENVQLNELGGFRTSYQPGTNCEKGKYTFHIKHGDWKQEFYPVLVDNYQPGAVRLELSEDKKVYGKNDTFTPLTAGRYLSGKTMAGDKPDYVFRFGRGHTLYSRGLRKEYAFGLDETFKVDWDKYKPVEGEGTFDAEGHFRPVIHLGKYKQIPHIIGMYYEINAETRQGNVLNHEIYMHYFPGDSAVGLCIPDGNEAGKPIEVDVAVINSTCKPADTRASMWIYKEREFVTETQNRWEKIKEYKDLKLKGKDTVKLESLQPGTYLLKCDAKDKDGDIISTSRTFYVGDYNSPYEDVLTLKAHKLRVPKAKETTPTNTTAQPANPAKLAITVTDSQGKGKKVRLFVYAVNETTLRLREYWPFPVDLVESFYYHTYQHYSANSTTLESRHRESTLFSALGSAHWDETGNCIVGHVTAENGKPLPGVKVYQRKYGSSSTDIQEPVLTDKNGFFLTDGHGSGNYIVSFNKKGYKSAYSPVHLETNEHGELKVTLQEKTAAETAAAAGKQKGAAGDDKYMLNGDREITCTIQQEDGSVIPGVWVGIFRRFSDGSSVKVDTAVSNEFGNVVFSRLQPGNYIVAPRVYGLKKICKEVELLTTDVTTTVQMEYTGWDLELESVARVPFPIDDENRITGPLFVVDKEAETRNAGIVAIVAAPVPIVDEEWHPEKTTWKRGGLANLLRKNYRDLLFFKTLETDDTGTVEITVTKPEPLSMYRIKAIAYTEDAFGRAEIKYR